MRIKIFASAAILLLAGCAAEMTDLESLSTKTMKIELSSSDVTLREGSTVSLTAVVRPWNSEDKDVAWKSSDESVASVTQTGLVTALSVGETVVSVECGGLIEECNVTVLSSRIPAEALVFDYSPFVVRVGSELTFYAGVLPEDSTDQLEWISSDGSVATIDAAGKFVALAPGNVKITAKAGDHQKSIGVVVYDGMYLIQTDALDKPVCFKTFGPMMDTVRVARGETATVQMIAFSDSPTGPLTPELMYLAPEGQSSGVILTPKMYWLPDIRCSNHWDGWAGGPAPDRYPSSELFLPDPMIPTDDPERGTVQLSAEGRMPLWLEFDIPSDMPAGVYDGKVKVSGNISVECPFVIKVYDVTLPERQELAILQWINTSELKTMNHGVNPSNAECKKLRYEKIIPALTAFGQNSFRLMDYDTPSHGTAVRNADGSWKLNFDFSRLEREILELYEVCPQLQYIQAPTGALLVSVAGKGEGKVALRGLELDADGNLATKDNGDGTYSVSICYKEQYRDPVPELKMYAQQYFRALDEFLKSKTLPDGRSFSDIFLQALVDEPNDNFAPTYEVISGYIKEVAPDINVVEPLGTSLIGPEFIDFPCPCIDVKVFHNDGEYPWTDDQTRWIYSAIGPQGDAINRFIRIPLIKTRMMHWLNYRYNATGYLHWGANYWPAGKDGDPWTDAQGSYIAGDTWIIWPGYQTVYPSIRLAAMRDGIRDFELLRLVEKDNPGMAIELCRKVAVDYVTHNTDLDNFREIRKTILELLSE